MLQRKTKGYKNVLQNLRHRPLQRFRIPRKSKKTRIWDASGDQEDQDQGDQDQEDQDQGDQDQEDQDQGDQEDASGDASGDQAWLARRSKELESETYFLI